MAYRDGTESLEERQRVLRRALDETRARAQALSSEEASLHRELAEIHRQLADVPRAQLSRRHLPLANVLLASPCEVPWTSMVGNDRVRHCASCRKDVHNLSAMTENEVHAFLERAQNAKATPGAPIPCVALYQRVDGTILTADCPVGVRRRRMRLFLGSSIGVGAAAVIAFTGLALLGVLPSFSAEKEPPPYEGPAQPYVLQGRLATDTVDSGTLNLTVRGASSFRVYEGTTYYGTSLTILNLSSGLHVLRIESDTGETRTANIWVYSKTTTHVGVTFEKALPPPVQMRAGGI